MSVTSGFFNSLNGDRKYNAEQMSSIFNGIINDGVFANIGTAFSVKANTGNSITVGIGRAWFNSAWVYNDAVLTLTADDSEVLLDRIDAVVIEINHTDSVREGQIKIIKGVAGSSPSRPTLTENDKVHQHPLAYIFRKANSTSITQSDITNMIGTSSCPYITGILQVQNIDNIVAQWQAQWDAWASEEQDECEEWMETRKEQFISWFSEIQGVLDGDTAGNLLNLINEKQDSEPGKGLSANDYTDEDKERVQNSIGVIVSSSTPPIEENMLWLKPVTE